MFITKKATTLILALTVLCANFLFSNSLSLEDNGDSTWNVNYSSDSDIGGFQFNVDGASIVSASGGDAAANGFMTSTSATTALGFSLTGAVIPAGEGTLLVLSLDGSPTGLSGIVVSDSSGNDLGFTFDGGDDGGDSGGSTGGDDGGEGVVGDEPNSLWLIDDGGNWSIGFK